MMMTVTIDGVTTVPEFGRWACYDRHAHRWLTADRIRSLVSAWFERYGAPFSGRTLDDQAVMEALVHAWDWVDWEFLETPARGQHGPAFEERPGPYRSNPRRKLGTTPATCPQTPTPFKIGISRVTSQSYGHRVFQVNSVERDRLNP